MRPVLAITFVFIFRMTFLLPLIVKYGERVRRLCSPLRKQALADMATAAVKYVFASVVVNVLALGVYNFGDIFEDGKAKAKISFVSKGNSEGGKEGSVKDRCLHGDGRNIRVKKNGIDSVHGCRERVVSGAVMYVASMLRRYSGEKSCLAV